MIEWLIIAALIELGVITIAALVVLDRSLKRNSTDMPLMLPIEELMNMRKDPRLNKPENGDEKGSGQYL